MTVTYGDKSSIRLLFRWHGSIWKSILKHYSVFLILYYAINFTYRFWIKKLEDESLEKLFRAVVLKLGDWTSRIPIQFLLGFYVTSVVARWWDQLNNIAWPDKFLIMCVGNIQGEDEDSRKIRRTFARYTNLYSTLVWKEISLKIKKRFPTDHHLVQAGLMTDEEFELFQQTTNTYGRWFVPISWMVNLISKCKEEDRISDYGQQKLLDELYGFRVTSAQLTIYDWVNIPLVYTQVVALATYGYFGFCLVARQSLTTGIESIAENTGGVEIYYPFFTTLEFLFYVGWLKVAEELRCPFGEGDEDFDMNFVLDRNIHVSNMLVEELHRQRPQLVQDSWWDEKYPKLPHTKASIKVADKIPNWRYQKQKVIGLEKDCKEAEEGRAKDTDKRKLLARFR